MYPIIRQIYSAWIIIKTIIRGHSKDLKPTQVLYHSPGPLNAVQNWSHSLSCSALGEIIQRCYKYLQISVHLLRQCGPYCFSPTWSPQKSDPGKRKFADLLYCSNP